MLSNVTSAGVSCHSSQNCRDPLPPPNISSVHPPWPLSSSHSHLPPITFTSSVQSPLVDSFITQGFTVMMGPNHQELTFHILVVPKEIHENMFSLFFLHCGTLDAEISGKVWTNKMNLFAWLNTPLVIWVNWPFKNYVLWRPYSGLAMA